MADLSRIIAVVPGCGEWNPGAKPPHFACDVLAKKGWAGWAKAYLRPAIDWFNAAGIRPRVMIYLPFSAQTAQGATVKGPMFEAAKLSGAHTGQFVKVLREYAKEIDLIAYMGTLKVGTQKTGLDFVQHVLTCIRPLIDAGIGYVVDEGADYLPDSREFLTLEMTRSLVPFVGYEGWPLTVCTNLHNKPLFLNENVWRTSPQFKERALLAWFTCEVIRYRDEDEYDGLGQPADVAQRVVDWTRGVLADGMTAAIPINDLLTAGVKASELLS